MPQMSIATCEGGWSLHAYIFNRLVCIREFGFTLRLLSQKQPHRLHQGLATRTFPEQESGTTSGVVYPFECLQTEDIILLQFVQSTTRRQRNGPRLSSFIGLFAEPYGHYLSCESLRNAVLAWALANHRLRNSEKGR